MACESAADGPHQRLRVVLFSGGRGSEVLTRQLVANPAVELTIAINGYDDGASTGEVRRLLGDSLGPSDFRKNALTVARTLRTCSETLVDLLERRLPPSYGPTDASAAFDIVAGVVERTADEFRIGLSMLSASLDQQTRGAVSKRLGRFWDELVATGQPFEFGDCSLGNLVFAGAFLLHDREFNRAVDDYCAILDLPPGVVENVTDGTNAWLVALDAHGRLLGTEAEIVDAARPNRIREIYLVDRPLTAAERDLVQAPGADADAMLVARQPALPLNPRLAPRIASADLIIYAPGTQHSSLFPSYLTQGLGAAIAENLGAYKVLVTNLQSDAEITGSSGVDLIGRALYYLKDKGRLQVPAPFLVTHSLINDPARAESPRPYVPLGPTEAIEDPRLVRIGTFEQGMSGRHDAARVLGPFVESISGRSARPRVAMLLYDDQPVINKLSQTLIELVRGGIAGVPVDLAVFYGGGEALEPRLTARLPFAVRHLPEGERAFTAAARPGGFDYVVLFESSGMYRGEEVIPLLSQLSTGRVDAVWGSRRLSLKDIEESYRFRYDRNVLLGTVSYLGSYALSLACLLLYGRYVSDTLCGVRALRAADAFEAGIDVGRKDLNHLLLARLLKRKAEILEMPVRFVPLSPSRVRRTGPIDGLHALALLVRERFAASRQPAPEVPAPAERPAPRTDPAK